MTLEKRLEAAERRTGAQERPFAVGLEREDGLIEVGDEVMTEAEFERRYADYSAIIAWVEKGGDSSE